MDTLLDRLSPIKRYMNPVEPFRALAVWQRCGPFRTRALICFSSSLPLDSLWSRAATYDTSLNALLYTYERLTDEICPTASSVLEIFRLKRLEN